MYRNFGFRVRELRRKHKGTEKVKKDKVSDEEDEHFAEPTPKCCGTQQVLMGDRANISRNEIRPTLDFEALDIAGDGFGELRKFLFICVYTSY